MDTIMTEVILIQPVKMEMQNSIIHVAVFDIDLIIIW